MIDLNSPFGDAIETGAFMYMNEEPIEAVLARMKMQEQSRPKGNQLTDDAARLAREVERLREERDVALGLVVEHFETIERLRAMAATEHDSGCSAAIDEAKYPCKCGFRAARDALQPGDLGERDD